ncbi:DUF7344 domain-containing protein [Natronolimnohabitans innermongolicus]|uniref:DUF7344 domain-containing protein n=1 Tax=Natronolimnohabitans innermongolicus JCM 12255 TaxID=1227499 RepID=L9XFV9_9EURY|nr:hypothetical protein [Natronolimnohabitans innermongolicus]ELY60619.1 hypothetical protein C493_04061 [Natronolimnohabitans innermongolicus JCM 12255]
MRLTPFWLYATSAGSAGDSSSDVGSGVTIYRSPSTQFSNDSSAEDHLPDTDEELLAVLDEMETPVTVDKIVDRLTYPEQPPVETWATVHERLYQTRLPSLEAAGHIEFDQEQGLVERSTVQADAASRRSSSGVGIVSLGLKLAVVVCFLVAAATTAAVAGLIPV